jgi:hypothetical protein
VHLTPATTACTPPRLAQASTALAKMGEDLLAPIDPALGADESIMQQALR